MDETVFQCFAYLADEGRSMMVVTATASATALLGVVVMSAMAFRLFVVVFMPATTLFVMVLVMATAVFTFVGFFSFPRGPRSIREG